MTRMPADNPQPSRRAMQALIQGVTTFDLAFAAVCLGAALLVYLAGAPPEIALIVGLAPFIGRHLYLLYRLSSLIGRHHRFTPPFPRGSWGRVFQAIAHYQQAIRRRRRRQLRFAHRFREAANSIPDALVILDKGHRIEWANASAPYLLDIYWPRDEGRLFTEVLAHPGLGALIDRADYGRPHDLSPPHNRALMLSFRISPFGGRKSQRLVVARDITAIYHLNMIRRDFVANASHELRTPLTVITGFLENLSYSPDTPASHQRPYELMVCQASRMRSIVEDLLTLSRLEMDDRTEQIGPVDIPEEIRTITHEAEALSEGRHKISLDVDQNLLVQGNLVELRSALSNLIYNAIKHTPAGSHVRIAWHREEAQPVFTVTDDGEGIAAEHIPRLTERFYRIDKGRSRASGGTGLGLAIVNHVLNRHEARLIIASEPGKGSTFTCRFPAASGLTRMENLKIDAGL